MARAERRVLVIAPHPDDESLGCGGTIKLLTDAKTVVDVCFLTRGEQGTEVPGCGRPETEAQLANVRTGEARDAARILGIDQTFFLDGRDGRLAEDPHIVGRLVELLGDRHYTQAFVPWPREAHVDHQTAFQFFQAALHRVPELSSIWLYEVWSPLSPNNYVPIDGTWEAKRLAIQAHHSQLECLDYLEAFLGLASYRALACPPSRYAEAFVVLDRDATLKLPSLV